MDSFMLAQIRRLGQLCSECIILEQQPLEVVQRTMPFVPSSRVITIGNSLRILQETALGGKSLFLPHNTQALSDSDRE
jgi:hypothetical protein